MFVLSRVNPCTFILHHAQRRLAHCNLTLNLLTLPALLDLTAAAADSAATATVTAAERDEA
jgi:hypothetical protein